MSLAEEVSVEDFEEKVIKSDVPVLVDFWAPWCTPCKNFLPILEDAFKGYQDRAKLVKVDVNENHELAQKYNLRSIPALFLFKDGGPVTVTGSLNREQLIDFLEGNL